MKSKLIILMLLLTGLSQAQKEQQTLFGGEKFSIRAFLSFNAKGMEINNQVGILTGGEVSLVFNHKLNIGFFGYGMINSIQSDYQDSQGYLHYYEVAMGGMKLEPVIWSNSVLHFTLPIELGIGGMSLNRHRIYDVDNYYYDDWENTLHDYDIFAFIEPGVRAELNLFKHMRIFGGVGYQMTDVVNLAGTEAFPLNGLTGNFGIKLGWF
jgi:hypothetical protein